LGKIGILAKNLGKIGKLVKILGKIEILAKYLGKIGILGRQWNTCEKFGKNFGLLGKNVVFGIHTNFFFNCLAPRAGHMIRRSVDIPQKLYSEPNIKISFFNLAKDGSPAFIRL
jgi:hypothetical protein